MLTDRDTELREEDVVTHDHRELRHRLPPGAPYPPRAAGAWQGERAG